ncbi:MAG: hypothetical protein O2962_00445 [Cyanobacteria bacterium]|nr:hypothetical protein [Cyanobacteriota bacterium]
MINGANNINTNLGSTMADLQDGASQITREESYFTEPSSSIIAKPVQTDTDDYMNAFINNKMVRDIVPHLMNLTNIAGNIFSFSSWAFGFNDASKKFAKTVGSLATKSFLVATSVINVVERLHTKNYFSALGYFNDIVIAGTVDQDNTYLARGIASGTYNMANSLNIANDRTGFDSFEDHLQHLVKGFGKFFKNLFSADVAKNFIKSENGMWATIGGLFANVGALSWMFTGKVQIPTFIRDLAGIVMDIEQLNFGHYKAGRKDLFKSGLALVVGTVADWLSKLMPQYKDAFVPLTFIFDGIGKHWLRLHQNEHEMGDKRDDEKQLEKLPAVKLAQKEDMPLVARRGSELLAQQVA